MRRRAALFILIGLLACAAAGCGGDDETSTAGTEPSTTATTGAGSESGDAANGAEVFASAGCGGCHTFSKASSSGSVGPDLDDVSPSFDAVVEQVTNGGGAMPSFEDDLSEQEIRDVAAFVSGSSS
jgi:mono/diheme cytochrome c family protein